MTEVIAHKFAEKSAHRLQDVTALKRVSDRYADSLAAVMEKAAGQSVEIHPQEIRFVPYSEWSSGLPALSSLSIYRLLPFKGAIFLRMDEAMVSSLLEVYFGGTLGSVITRTKDSFRSTEMQLIQRLAQSLLNKLGDCYSEYSEMKPAFLTHETSVSYLTLCDQDEQVMCHSFDICLESDVKWTVELVYSADAADSALELVQTKTTEQAAAPDPLWQQRWTNNLKQVHLPLRTILAQPTMTLPQLFEMKVGDVIPITPRTQPPLFVANRKIALGTLGEKNGCAAYKIENMEQGNGS